VHRRRVARAGTHLVTDEEVEEGLERLLEWRVHILHRAAHRGAQGLHRNNAGLGVLVQGVAVQALRTSWEVRSRKV
jgi:hypothetical protein